MEEQVSFSAVLDSYDVAYRSRRERMSSTNGVAPVKAEYLIAPPERPATSGADGSDAAATADSAAATAGPPSAAGPPRKKQKGMNKNRGSYRPAKAEVRLCTAVVQGRECKFGDGCKYSHDLVAYRTTCPPDLGELCPIYSVNGYCRFGVTCRFGGAHGASNTPPAQPVDSERNVAPAALTSRLRKHEYDFSGAAHALRQWDAINEHRKPSEGQEAGAAAAAQAAAAQAQAGASDGPAPAVDGPGKEESARAEGATGADAAEGLEGGCTAGGGGHYPSGSVATRERRAVDWRRKPYSRRSRLPEMIRDCPRPGAASCTSRRSRRWATCRTGACARGTAPTSPAARWPWRPTCCRARRLERALPAAGRRRPLLGGVPEVSL